MAQSICRAGWRPPSASMRSMISVPIAPFDGSGELSAHRPLTRGAASETHPLPGQRSRLGAIGSRSRRGRWQGLLRPGRPQRSAAEPAQLALPGRWAGGLPGCRESPVPDEGARAGRRSQPTLAYARDLWSVPAGPALGMNVPRGTKTEAAREPAGGSASHMGWLGFARCSTWNMTAELHQPIALSREPAARVSGSSRPLRECNPQ